MLPGEYQQGLKLKEFCSTCFPSSCPYAPVKCFFLIHLCYSPDLWMKKLLSLKAWCQIFVFLSFQLQSKVIFPTVFSIFPLFKCLKASSIELIFTCFKSSIAFLHWDFTLGMLTQGSYFEKYFFCLFVFASEWNHECVLTLNMFPSPKTERCLHRAFTPCLACSVHACVLPLRLQCWDEL